MSLGVQKPFLDYTQSGDSGQDESASVGPIANGEDLDDATLNRPSEALRKRTERIRDVLDDSIYLRDADRHFVLAGPGTVTWPGASPGQNGIPTLSDNLYIIPFLTPGKATNTPPIASVFGSLTLTKSGGGAGIVVTSQRRNYEGGNKINVTVQSGGSTTAVIQGTPLRNILVTAASGATLGPIITLIEGLLDEQGTPAVRAELAGGAGSGDLITTTQAQQYIQGNWDAEGHVLTPAAFASFFASSPNVLKEGDTLAVWFAALTEDPDHPSTLGAEGGRRQSIPENSNTTVPAGSLFNSRVHPERLTNAIPIAKVISGNLILIDGTSLSAGESGVGIGDIGANEVLYQGGPDWADAAPTHNPATTVEAQLDKIVHDLADTGADGPERIHALASGVFMTIGTLRHQLDQLDTALDAVVNNGALPTWADGSTTIGAMTTVAQLARIVHDLADSGSDGTALLHGTAGGTFIPAGTLRAQLIQLDAAIVGRAPFVTGCRAAAAVIWGGSSYTYGWSVGFSGSPANPSTGVVNMTLTVPLSSISTGAVFLLPNSTPSTSIPFFTKSLIGGGGSTVQALLYESDAIAARDGSFYVVVFGA